MPNRDPASYPPLDPEEEAVVRAELAALQRYAEVAAHEDDEEPVDG